MEELVDRINALSDSDLIEATSYYLAERLEATSSDGVTETLMGRCQACRADYAILDQIQDDMSRDRDSYSRLFRFLLLDAARGDHKQCQLVQETIEGVGQKQVATELLLAISLGTLATMLLIQHTKGKKEEWSELELTQQPDGSIRLVVRKQTIYADASTPLGRLLSFLKDLPLGVGQEE